MLTGGVPCVLDLGGSCWLEALGRHFSSDLTWATWGKWLRHPTTPGLAARANQPSAIASSRQKLLPPSGRAIIRAPSSMQPRTY